MSSIRDILATRAIGASAPCRVDLGGTLDISTFYLPLHRLDPCTFNIAVGLRTEVRLKPHDDPHAVQVVARGVAEDVFDAGQLPFKHPLGLMFAVAAHFGASGVRIEIDSASPPRSALGGSSVAAVALVAAFYAASGRVRPGQAEIPVREIALLAHAIEAAVAGVPCGMQDQLAAAYGGINAWHWTVARGRDTFRQAALDVADARVCLQDHLLLAYCGVPHVSKDVNGHWVDQFLSGRCRSQWEAIVDCTRRFVAAWRQGDWSAAADCMRTELALRCEMTPDVLDDVGRLLCDAAAATGCGARFSGAGGGGCIWALGDREHIATLRGRWQEILAGRETACLLPFSVDTNGVQVFDEALDWNPEPEMRRSLG